MRKSDDASRLASYVAAARAQGQGREEIAEALRNAGWSESDVRNALSGWDDASAVPETPRPSRPWAREGLLYGLIFVALGVTAWNIASFAFAAIAILLPDLKTVRASWWLQEELLWSISMLVVFFPVFLVLHLWIAGRAAADPTHRLSLAARRFAYVALFLAAVAILVVLAVTIYTFLSGEVTERFMLKALTVAIVAGVVFMYFQQSLRSEASRRWPSPVIALSVMVVLVVGVDWWITDSPHSRQILKRDETRLHDLSALAPFVRCVAQRNNNRLPEKLPIRPEDAPGCGAQDLRFSDPYTGKPYLYEKIDDRTFRLCADFERVTMVSPFDTETLGIRFDGVRGCIVALYVSR